MPTSLSRYIYHKDNSMTNSHYLNMNKSIKLVRYHIIIWVAPTQYAVTSYADRAPQATLHANWDENLNNFTVTVEHKPKQLDC